MNNFAEKLTYFFRKKSVRYAIPFLTLVVGGSFGLKEFSRLRYDFSRVNPVREEAQKVGIEMKKPSEITIEKEYERLKELDIDNWEQIRGPRPWEENFDEGEEN
ncbi:cytochrome c oxidase assembly protein COX16 homolog, mitochondrial [Onthophagus taurus]|uniref:cytochrome c oxidase assembly protein COX16 homolog, mitochondrial n=1 Tax=Onthophagus taurus TaxID=166361 RepID=UPI0039BEB452